MRKDDVISLFYSAVNAVQPEIFMKNHLAYKKDTIYAGGHAYKVKKSSRVIITGAGKASAAMAAETEKMLGVRISDGLIVTKYGHSLPLEYLEIIESGHPVPDQNGITAAIRLADKLQGLTDNDIVIHLVSGGASSLLADIPAPVSLDDMQTLVSLLLKCGATIREMNTVRKHISFLKGGQLLRLIYPATVISFIISDVTGDPLDVIASGSTVPDPTSFNDAWMVIQKYQLDDQLPLSIKDYLTEGVEGKRKETVKPGDEVTRNSKNILVATNQMALSEAFKKAAGMGYDPIIVSDELQGEAFEQGRSIADFLIKQTSKIPLCFIWGGETTVTLRGKGIGGRNQELALAALKRFTETEYDTGEIVLLSAGTDGSDGPTDATGAVIDSEMIRSMKEKCIDIDSYLRDNNSYNFFNQNGGHLKTGPTNTNVMDIVIALVV